MAQSEPPPKRGKRPVVVTEIGKVCTECAVDKPLTDYTPYVPGTLGRMAACRACCRVVAAARAARRSPEEKRDRWLRRVYGIGHAEYAAMLASQGGRCAICGSGDSRDSRFGWFHIDHDHSTGRIRALLCGPCNIGLGHFDDSPDRLLAAAAYLLQHADVQSLAEEH